MKKIYLLLVFILMSSCTNSKKVVFLGDSITAAGVYDKEIAQPYGDTFVYPISTGFITLLNENVGDDVELIGKGVSGDKVTSCFIYGFSFINSNNLLMISLPAPLFLDHTVYATATLPDCPS